MAYVHRETNWGARIDASANKDGDKAGKNGTTERSNHLAQVNHSALRRLMNSTASIDASPTSINRQSQALELVELVEAHDVTLVAVTADPELRAALTEVLPRNSIVFADSPEQVLGRSVPNNCAVLIVEQSLSRAEFEQLKSHLKAAAPALVNIMVGTRSDGSTLVGLLSKGWIDRFMVKPLEPGPTRIALRSALQQHNSLRSLVKIESVKSDAPAAGSAPRIERDVPLRVPTSTIDRVKHSDKPEIVAVALEKIEHVSIDDVAESLKHDLLKHDSLKEVSEDNLKLASDAVTAPQREPAIRAATSRQLSPPSWSTFAAMIAVVALIAALVTWGMSTRSPNVDANKAMINKIVADHLAAAQRAFELGSYVDPPGLSATHFYDAVLELDPTNEQAKHGLNAVADRLIADSKQLIGTGDLLRAQSALDNIRRMQPNHRELAEVIASLLSAREAERLTIQAAHAVASPTFEPIVVTAQQGAVASQRAAPASVGKASANSSTNNERKVANRYQRQEYQWQSEPRAVGGVGSASASNSLLAAPVASAASSSSPSLNSPAQPRDSQLNLESSNSNLQHADEGKTLEPAQGEVEARAAAVVAAMRETTTSDATVSSVGDTGQADSGLRDTAIKAGIIKPTLIKYVPPVYPISGRAEGATGWLDVEFLVTSDGRVINPHIAKGTLGSKFHRAALAAANQWKFSPATDGARPNLPMKLRLEFRLTE